MAWCTLKILLKFTDEEVNEVHEHISYLTNLRGRARATEHKSTVNLYQNLLNQTVEVWLKRDRFLTEEELRDLLDEVMDDFHFAGEDEAWEPVEISVEGVESVGA